MDSLRRLCGDGHRAIYTDPAAWMSQPGRRLIPLDADGEQWIERRRCLGCGEVLRRLCLVKIRYLDEPPPNPAPLGAPLFSAYTLRLDVLRQQAVRLAYAQGRSLQKAADLLGASRRTLYGWIMRDPKMLPERKRYRRRRRPLLLPSVAETSQEHGAEGSR